MRVRIYPYKTGSSGAKALSEALGVRRLRHEGSRFLPTEHDTIINWGSTSLPDTLVDYNILNTPISVRDASNKLSFFRSLDGSELVPQWTEDIDTARGWSRAGEIVVCRTVLSGHSGQGIIIAETEEGLVEAPLYVMYRKKSEEFRIHVAREEGGQVCNVFDVQRKARRRDVENPNWRVRNYDNGFIYQRNDIQIPEVCTSAAVVIFNETGLDFGAVDVIYNSHEQRSYVLEINTAPGLTGTTLEKYVEMFQRILYPN